MRHRSDGPCYLFDADGTPAQEQPEWKWVPVEPTQEMVDAAQFACGGNQGAYWAPESDDEWRAAIASALGASPTPPKEK